MSDLSDYYRKRRLFRVVVITRDENNKLSGVEDENVYEAILRRSALGDDAETNLITLCREWHQILHGIRRDRDSLNVTK